MTDTTQTSVKGADDPVKPGTEGQDAKGTGDDLDTILGEIEAEATTEAKPAEKEDAKAKPKGIDPLVETLVRKEIRRDLNAAITAMQADNEVLKGISPLYIENLMNAEAKRDPRILKAWNNRETDPATWEKLVPVLGKMIAKGLGGLIDQETTESRQAVIASVKGKSPGLGGAKDTVDLSAMSDAEFEAFKRKKAAEARRR